MRSCQAHAARLVVLLGAVGACGRANYRSDPIDSGPSIDARVAPDLDAYGLDAPAVDAPSADARIASDARLTADTSLDGGTASDAGRDASLDAAAATDTFVEDDAAITPATAPGCPALWYDGFASSPDVQGLAIDRDHALFVASFASSAPLRGSVASGRVISVIDTASGTELRRPTFSTVTDWFAPSATVESNTVFMPHGMGVSFLDTSTGTFGPSVSYTPGAGNGGGHWSGRSGQPWSYATTAFADAESLGGRPLNGTNTDLIVATGEDGAGAIAAARRLVLPGTQVAEFGHAVFRLADGRVLASTTMETATSIDGVSLPSGVVLLELAPDLTVLSARAAAPVVAAVSRDGDRVYRRANGLLRGERGDGTTIFDLPLGTIDPRSVTVLDDESIAVVGTLTGTTVALGQTFGAPGRSIVVLVLTNEGALLAGSTIPVGGDFLLSHAVTSSDGAHLLVSGYAFSDQPLAICGDATRTAQGFVAMF
ncbi:MAG: hypothetical protein J0L92_04100 [Deltaproteobacteria bacterium]|nr:hypothetical protein [Deltaproteobacteria bacterium]